MTPKAKIAAIFFISYGFSLAKLRLALNKTKFVPKTLEIGQKGEEIALSYLQSKGYEILHVNWRSGHLELDIVAKDKAFLVVIEVKTRKNADFGDPETFVSRDKQTKLIRATQNYVRNHGVTQEVRFDIVTIITSTGKVQHIERAFYPRIRH